MDLDFILISLGFVSVGVLIGYLIGHTLGYKLGYRTAWRVADKQIDRAERAVENLRRQRVSILEAEVIE